MGQVDMLHAAHACVPLEMIIWIYGNLINYLIKKDFTKYYKEGCWSVLINISSTNIFLTVLVWKIGLNFAKENLKKSVSQKCVEIL